MKVDHRIAHQIDARPRNDPLQLVAVRGVVGAHRSRVAGRHLLPKATSRRVSAEHLYEPRLLVVYLVAMSVDEKTVANRDVDSHLERPDSILASVLKMGDGADHVHSPS